MVGGCCLFSGQEERTLQVEIFAQGVWRVGRVRVSPFTKNTGESGLLRTRRRGEFSFGQCSDWHLSGNSTRFPECREVPRLQGGSQVAGSCRSQHEPAPTTLSHVDTRTQELGRGQVAGKSGDGNGPSVVPALCLIPSHILYKCSCLTPKSKAGGVWTALA